VKTNKTNPKTNLSNYETAARYTKKILLKIKQIKSLLLSKTTMTTKNNTNKNCGLQTGLFG